MAMAAIPERLQDGIEQSDTWLIPKLPRTLEPTPAADEEPLSFHEKCWLDHQSRAARVQKNIAFNERLQRFRQEQAHALTQRNVVWAGQIISQKMFVGSSEHFFIVVLPSHKTRQNAVEKVKSTLDLGLGELDLDGMVALDRFGMELLGLSPWPAPPEGLIDDFAENPTLRKQIEAKVPGYRDLSEFPRGAIPLDVVLYEAPPPNAPPVVWLGPQPTHLTVGTADKMAGLRRMFWVVGRLHHMGISVEDLEPTLANFVPFSRVLEGTLAAGTKLPARFNTAKALYVLYAQKYYDTHLEEVRPGLSRFRDFNLDDVRKWPGPERSQWELFSKGEANEYCLECSKKLKGAKFGVFCSLKCIPRRHCGACMKELTVEQVTELRLTRADHFRRATIGDLCDVLALRPKVEAIARAPKCCWVSKSWLNCGALTLTDGACTDCTSLPIQQVESAKGFSLKRVWSQDWPAVQKELDELRAIPNEPQEEVVFKQFVCKTLDCPEPGRLMDHECDSFTRQNREYAKFMADYEERQKKRARTE